jgi:hypothetical protein
VGAVHEEWHSFHVKDADVHFKAGLGWGMVFNAGVIRIRISKKNRQHNGQKKKVQKKK